MEVPAPGELKNLVGDFYESCMKNRNNHKFCLLESWKMVHATGWRYIDGVWENKYLNEKDLPKPKTKKEKKIMA